MSRYARYSDLPLVETMEHREGVAQWVAGRLSITTRGQSFTDITAPIAQWLDDMGAGIGMVNVFLRHTSASLTIQENADPTVQQDLIMALDRLAPERAGYRHDYEGDDDMPAHIKSVLSGVSLQVPVVNGVMDLGTWQGIYLIEHRRAPHTRTISLQFNGLCD